MKCPWGCAPAVIAAANAGVHARCRVGSLAAHWRHVGLAVVLGWTAALTKEIGITIVSLSS